MPDNPTFAFRIDEESRSWALYRQTRTQERPIAVRTRDRVFWFDQDRDEDPGATGPVTDRFLDAVGALFLRAPAGRNWTLDPIFEALTWYESECIEDLRRLRNDLGGLRKPENQRMRADGQDPARRMPDEAWDLVKTARSQFSLSGSRAYKPGDPSTGAPQQEPHADAAELSSFSGDDT